MKPEELQELRDWCAKKMGWRRLPACGAMNQDFYEDEHEQFKFWAEKDFQEDNVWEPDLPNGQIEMLINKMVEEGWRLTLITSGELSHTMFDRNNNAIMTGWFRCYNRRIAIMLAARATE